MISIPSKNVKTISLINLTVPSTVPIGQILSLTLKAEKEQSVGGKVKLTNRSDVHPMSMRLASINIGVRCNAILTRLAATATTS
jgi:hypothetical protein